MHHMVQEADGGPNILENAIVLCSKCHSEAGHYIPRHPLGTKYSPNELRRHRDEWWEYRASRYASSKKPADFHEPPGSGRGVPVHRRNVGVLWSRRADIEVESEIVEFEERLLAKNRFENQSVVRWMELFARTDGTFLVYVESNHRCDWGSAFLDGAPPDYDPLHLDDLHEKYPSLATAAGIQRIRRL